jgi:DNA-binding NtrC family response regulator
MVTLVLTKQGYKVHSFGNSSDALNFIRLTQDSLDILLTDIILPGVNGKELYNQALRIHPDLRVLFMSGYTGDIFSLNENWSSNFIQKPFSRENLLNKIREILDKNP